MPELFRQVAKHAQPETVLKPASLSVCRYWIEVAKYAQPETVLKRRVISPAHVELESQNMLNRKRGRNGQAQGLPLPFTAARGDPNLPREGRAVPQKETLILGDRLDLPFDSAQGRLRFGRDDGRGGRDC